MAVQTTWNGSREEGQALLAAVRRHCTCAMRGERIVAVCEAHRMLALDQRALDGLLFARHIAWRLAEEEL